MKARIAITLGDPAGIGPEIVAKALRHARVRRVCEPVVFGRLIRVPLGKPSRQAGLCATQALEAAWQCVQSGDARALVTAPVSKESFERARYGFPGHTEWLAAKSHARDVAMLMAAGPLRAILMTRHIPIKDVSKTLTTDILLHSARLGYAFIREQYPRAKKPRLVLCGLNPHAGDHGIIGREEDRLFRPALQKLRREGLEVAGPLPADAVFPKMAEGQFDLALAAYHDQGMIPLKLYAPGKIVNVTLGLPFIRTSPGHGTAYDIAGKNKADPEPMIEAICLAAKFAR